MWETLKQNILYLISKLILETDWFKNKTKTTTKKRSSPYNHKLLTLVMFTKRLANPLGNHLLNFAFGAGNHTSGELSNVKFPNVSE